MKQSRKPGKFLPMNLKGQMGLSFMDGFERCEKYAIVDFVFQKCRSIFLKIFEGMLTLFVNVHLISI